MGFVLCFLAQRGTNNKYKHMSMAGELCLGQLGGSGRNFSPGYIN